MEDHVPDSCLPNCRLLSGLIVLGCGLSWKLLYLLQVAIKSLNLFRIFRKNPVEHFTQIVLPGSFRQPTDQNFLGAVRDIFTYDQLCNSTIDNKAATLRDRTKDQTKD